MEKEYNKNRVVEYINTAFQELHVKYKKDKYVVFCVFMKNLKNHQNLDIAYCNTICNTIGLLS